MKLKYFLSFFALIALLSSCSDNDSMTLLDEIQVSSSYVSIDKDGGTATITVNAQHDWFFDKVCQQITKNADGSKDTTYTELPSWLSVSQLSGPAGETKITFSADSASDGRSVELHMLCNGKTQRINVIQGTASTDIITVREAIAMVQANQSIEKTVFVKGIVCKIDEISKQYGNATYYISDDGTFKGGYTADGSGDGNWLEIYRGYWIDGESFKSGDEFEVGDEMVITGIIMSYKGTPEIKEKTGQVVSHTKSLIKVDSLSTKEALPVEGGNVTAFLTCKGNGISVSIPEDANNWLFISGINGNEVTFHALPNTGGARNATVIFKTTDDGGKEYTAQATINQKGAIVACTVAEFLAAEEGATQYRLNGMVVGKYRDTQGFYVRDYTGEVLIYKPSGFTGTEVNVGDVVTVLGVRTSYQGNPQMGSATLEKINYTAQPISIADFRNLPDNKEAYYIISGEIVNATEPNTKNDVTQYGNFNLKDETGEVYIYGVYTGWGGQKGHFGELDLTWNDHLTIVAYKTSYNGLIEGVGYYLSSEKAR